MSIFSRLPLLAFGLMLASPSWASDPIPVTVTFSLLGDLVKQVGGDKVKVSTLVGPDGDAHVYQPTPQDVQALSKARVLVSNGLGFEGWLERLDQASGVKGVKVVASTGVKARHLAEEGHDEKGHHEEAHHHHGSQDPHAWNDPLNVLTYVDNIAAGLGKVDPENAALYGANAASYKAQITSLDMRYKLEFAKLPEERRRAITSHDAFGYLAAAYHLNLLAPQGMSTDAEPSAAQVAALIRQIRSQKIPALFVENISDPRLIEQISRETGVKVGGKLYSDALSPADGPAASYLAFVDHNLSTLLAALKP